MKYILPALGLMGLTVLFGVSTDYQATAVERASNADTYRQLDVFADVLARVRADYVVETDDTEMIDNAINGMLQSLDPHSSYLSPDDFEDMSVSTRGEYGGLGLEVTMQDGVVSVVSPIDDTPAEKAGMQSGDLITHIDGNSIIGMSLSEAVDEMRGPAGEPIVITVVREGVDPFDVTLVRAVIKTSSVRYRIEDGVPYLRISQFNERTAPTLDEALKEMEADFGSQVPGIIVDLRNNPGGLLDQSIKVSSAFLDGGEVVSTRGRRAEDTERYNAARGDETSGAKVVVLINGASASASEIVAGAIQDRGRGLIVGTQSFGKGSVQSVIPLNGGQDGALRLTTARYYTPAGRSIQATGIVPDIAIGFRRPTGDERFRLSERNLRNALENEDTPEGEETEDVTAEEEEVDLTEYPPEDWPEGEDYQLKRAIEILKSADFNQKLASAATP